MWKRGEIAPKEQFLLFSTLYIYIFSNSGVKLQIHLLNVVVKCIGFLTHSTLICRGTDISKYFSESLGIRDNESRLYIDPNFQDRMLPTQRGLKPQPSDHQSDAHPTEPSKPGGNDRTYME